jgi:hypothetical protein
MGFLDFLEDLAHLIFGLLSALSVVINPVLTIISFLIFVMYELDQDFRLNDYSYQEFCQFGLGFGLGMFFLLLLHLSPFT